MRKNNKASEKDEEKQLQYDLGVMLRRKMMKGRKWMRSNRKRNLVGGETHRI